MELTPGLSYPGIKKKRPLEGPLFGTRWLQERVDSEFDSAGIGHVAECIHVSD